MRTVAIHLTEHEAKIVLMVLFLRAEDQKLNHPVAARKYRRIARKLEKQGVVI